MHKILLTLVSFVSLSALVACGGGNGFNSNITPIPPAPTGGNNAGFSNASLTGTYIFSANGVNSSNSFAVVGRFVADGAGHITSGIRDTVTDGGAQALGESITGTYSVNQDGRAQAVLNGTSGQIIYRFVMQSPSAAKLFQISNFSDATGRIQLVGSVTPAIASSAPYVIRLQGEDFNLNPYGAVGALTLSGTTLTGTIDENDAGIFSAQLSPSGTFTAPDSNGRGTLTYTASTGTHNFVYYWVSPTKLELISTDPRFFLHGYADQQQSGIGTADGFTGDQVFAISGYSSVGLIVETGRLTLSGGNLANAIEDYNENGSYFDSITFTGTYAVTANGRWTASPTYTSSTLGLVGWQVSPTQSVLMTTTSSITNYAIVETGTMRSQTLNLTNANVTGNYAENLSGIILYSPSGNVETSGNFLADGNGNLSGTIDSQTPSNVNTSVPTTGNYSVNGSTGRALGTIGAVPVHVYVADPSTIYMISTDPSRIYQGKMELQQ